MKDQIILNDYPINTEKMDIGGVVGNSNQIKLSITFQVTHADYHDVTTLLYQNDFTVDIPSERLLFPAVIHNYSTSIDNLYEEGAVGTFYLELVEKIDKA